LPGAHRQRICDLGGDLDDADGGERDRRVLERPSGPAKDHGRHARPPRAARRRQRSRHVDIAPFLGSEDESEDNDGDGTAGPKAKEKKTPEKNSVHPLLSLQSHRRALQSAWPSLLQLPLIRDHNLDYPDSSRNHTPSSL